MTDTKVALAVGGSVWVLSIIAYAIALTIRGRSDLPLALLYNAPIVFLFLVSLGHAASRAARLGLHGLLRRNGASTLVWIVGLVLLYLRLVAKNIEVSGHLVWLPLLTAQVWLCRFPAWVTAVGVLSVVSALYLKLAIFQGPSGVPGLAAGVFLATLLVVLSGGREPRAVEQLQRTRPASDGASPLNSVLGRRWRRCARK